MDSMTIAETCEVLRLSRWTLGALIKADEIKATKTDPGVRNSAVAIDPASVQSYIDRHTVPATYSTGE